MNDAANERNSVFQPLFQLIWPEWFKAWTGPRSESFDRLSGLSQLIGRYRDTRFDMTTVGALSTKVDRDDLAEFCRHFVETETTSVAFESAIRLLRLLKATSSAETLVHAAKDGKCDSTELTEVALALEAFGSLSDDVFAIFSETILSLDELHSIPHGALGLIVRHGDSDQRNEVVRILASLIGDGEETERDTEVPADLGEILLCLDEQGEDVGTLVAKTMARKDLPRSTPLVESVFRIASRIGIEIPFQSLAEESDRFIGTTLFQMILRDPSSFRGCRCALEAAIDTFCDNSSVLGPLAITSCARLGSDHTVIEPYCSSGEWAQRIGGYWGLYPGIDKKTLDRYLKNEVDSDAEDVLTYLKDLVDGLPASIQSNIHLSEYDCINTILHYDPEIPVFRDSISGIMREVKRDFGQNLTGQELSMVVADNSFSVFGNYWMNSDDEDICIALATKKDPAAAATAELLVTKARTTTELTNASLILSAVGGPVTEIGETLIRLISYDEPPRWIDENRYTHVEHLAYSDDEDVVKLVARSLERSVLARRPNLLQRLWDAVSDDTIGLILEIIPDVTVRSVFAETVSRISRAGAQGTETLALFSAVDTDNDRDIKIFPEPERLGNVPLTFELWVIARKILRGDGGYLREYARKTGIDLRRMVSVCSCSTNWQIRRAAMIEIRDCPLPEYVAAVLGIFENETDTDVSIAASEAYKRLQERYPELLPGILLLTNTDSDGNPNTSDDWDVLFDAYNETSFPEEKLPEYYRRRLIIEPVSSVPETPGTLLEEEWRGIACNLAIEYQDESAGHILAVVNEEASAEIFGMILNGKMVRAFVGRWA